MLERAARKTIGIRSITMEGPVMMAEVESIGASVIVTLKGKSSILEITITTPQRGSEWIIIGFKKVTNLSFGCSLLY